MMWLYHFCVWLQHTSVGVNVSESLWLFPLIETVHIWGIICLVGCTGVLDLRLLGLILTNERITELHNRLIKWTWFGFAVMLTSGSFMFASEATKMYENGAFRVKMLLIIAAGLNAMVFELIASRNIANWDIGRSAPALGKFCACFSLIAWVGVIAAGRWIAYW
jgi:hypothetical protein